MPVVQLSSRSVALRAGFYAGPVRCPPAVHVPGAYTAEASLAVVEKTHTG